MKSKDNRWLITLYMSLFMIFFALIITMFSTVLPKITELYGLSMTQVSMFTIVQNYLATFISTFLLIGWGDRFPKGIVIGIDALLMGFLLFGIETLPPYLVLMLLFSTLNMTTGILNNLITAFVSDIYGEKRTRYISMMHVFYSAGALFGPLLPGAVTSLGYQWNLTFAFLGGLVLAATVTYFLVMAGTRQFTQQTREEAPDSSEESLTFLQILKAPMLIPLCLLNMIYMGGHQNIFANWFQLFLHTVDPVRYPESFTSFCMTVYWIGMLGSRLLSAYLADKIAPRRFILCGSFVGVLAQILGLACNQPMIWLLACALLGLCTGAVFPLTFAIAITWFPKNSARISSLIGIGTSIGGALISLITGRIAEGSFTLAMLVPVCSLAGVFLLMRFRFPRETA